MTLFFVPFLSYKYFATKVPNDEAPIGRKKYFENPREFLNIFLKKDMHWWFFLVLQSNAAPSSAKIDSLNVIDELLNQPPDQVEDYISVLVVQKVKMMMNAYESNQMQIQSDMFRQLNEIDQILDETKNMRKIVCKYYLACMTFCIAIGVVVGLIGGLIMEFRKLAFTIRFCTRNIIHALLIILLFALIVLYLMFCTNDIVHVRTSFQ